MNPQPNDITNHGHGLKGRQADRRGECGVRGAMYVMHTLLSSLGNCGLGKAGYVRCEVEFLLL